MAAGGCDPPLRNGGRSGGSMFSMTVLVHPPIPSGERSRTPILVPYQILVHPPIPSILVQPSFPSNFNYPTINKLSQFPLSPAFLGLFHLIQYQSFLLLYRFCNFI